MSLLKEWRDYAYGLDDRTGGQGVLAELFSG